MSQEEIESLMNGLDFGNDDAEEESTEDNKENQSNETTENSKCLKMI
ncbi:MAG: hypothetical protein ACNI22_05345 [Halarcobacter sp.]